MSYILFSHAKFPIDPECALAINELSKNAQLKKECTSSISITNFVMFLFTLTHNVARNGSKDALAFLES